MNEFGWVVVGASVLSGFFSLTGYALRAMRRTQLEEAFGQQGAARLKTLERHVSELRLTTAFCRTLCNLMIVLGLAALLGGAGDWRGVLEALAAALAIIAVFGIAIPHAWAQHGGERVLAASLGVLMLCRYLFWPVVAFMRAFETPVRRLAGVGDDEPPEQIARQEIIQAATEAQAEGSVGAEEAQMIASVMQFGDTQVGQVMIPRTEVFAIEADTPWQQACQRVVAGGHSRVPVYQDDLDNVVGVLYAKDLLGFIESDPPPISRIMRKPYFVPQTKLLSDLLREFRTRKVHIAVVLDEFGGTAGVVTIEDVLEEIVGEISDEYDRGEPALLHRLDQDTAQVDGRLAVDELNEAMGLNVPEQADYTTVAGMVFSELGYVPRPGETLDAFGARFTVLAANERKITQIKVERLPPQKET